MSVESISSELTSRPLPPWTQDVNRPDAPVPSSEGATTGAGAGRLDADQNILDLFRSSHAEALGRWRYSYHQRVRCGTNRELWMFTATAALIAHVALQDCRNQRAGLQLVIFGRLLEEHDLCSLIKEIVSQDDFFDEYPVSHSLG